MGYDYDGEDSGLGRIDAGERTRRQALEEGQSGRGERSEGHGTSRRAAGSVRRTEESKTSRGAGEGSGRPDHSGGGGKGPDGSSGTNARSVARQKKRARDKKRKRIIITIIAEIFALLFIFGYAYAYKLYSKPQRQPFNKKEITNQELTVEDIKKMKGYWMIAIFGVDSRGNNVGKGTNADVNMIACINQDTGDIKLVSVFRDTYLSIDDQGSYNKINAAYANGGPEQAVKALNKNLDLNITDYITFNWKGVADAINILGGVDVEITKPEFRYINSFITETVESTGIGSHHLKSAGMNHLDGVQAVAYGRLRLMDTDYARTERQRKIIQLAFDKAKTAEYSVLNNILVVVLPQVATSLDFADLTNVALNITKYKLGETGGFPFDKGDANMGKKGACVIPKTLESNVVKLHQFLFGDEIYTTTETVKKISARIASDTGMYKQKQQSDSAASKAKEESEAAEQEMESSDEGESSQTMETDVNGRPVLPGPPETDEEGNIIPGATTGDGSLLYPGQGESSGAIKPTGPSDNLGPNNPSNPGNPQDPTDSTSSGDFTNPGGSLNPGGPTNPTSSTSSGTPGSPTETTPKETESSGGPGETSAAAPENTLPINPAEPESTTAVNPGNATESASEDILNRPGDAIGNNGPGEA